MQQFLHISLPQPGLDSMAFLTPKSPSSPPTTVPFFVVLIARPATSRHGGLLVNGLGIDVCTRTCPRRVLELTAIKWLRGEGRGTGRSGRVTQRRRRRHGTAGGQYTFASKLNSLTRSICSDHPQIVRGYQKNKIFICQFQFKN